MTAGIKANLDGSAAVQVGNTDFITTTSGGAVTIPGTLTVTGATTFSGAATFSTSPTTVQAGTVSAPSITTASDTNTGIFFPAADTIAFAEGGTEALRINSSAQIEFTAGSASTPSVTFTGDTNTGIYSPGADRIGFAEGGTQVGEFNASGNFLFNSGYGSVAIAYGCRAWVNFNGSGTVAIRASGNVSSITDNGGLGDYTINFSTAISDANYNVVSSVGSVTTTNVQCVLNVVQTTQTGGATLKSTSQVRIATANGSTGAKNDNAESYVSIFR
jgi:hypothetical protein